MLAVVVPAHNEAKGIARCLLALKQASACEALQGEPVQIFVCADACTDSTAALAADHGATVLALSARNVGAARGLGAAAALQAGARWLAFTDADTVVSNAWLADQLSLNVDVVCGTVAVEDWGQYGAAMRKHYSTSYNDSDGHGHIHGANLGVSADAYRRCGGFLPLASSEDVALVNALMQCRASFSWSAKPRVTTSARHDFRAPDGFGATLQRVAREAAGQAVALNGQSVAAPHCA